MERMMRRKNLEYIETSALLGLNTQTAVMSMANYIYNNIDNESSFCKFCFVKTRSAENYFTKNMKHTKNAPLQIQIIKTQKR